MVNRYYKKGIRRGVARIAGQKKYQSLIRKNKDKRILVFLHLFYPESWKEIREYLRNFEGYHWDLCITYPDFLDEKEGFQEIREDIRRLNPGTEFFCFENRGFDIGPFLTALRQRGTDGYDVVFKLQSKGTKRPWIYIYRQLFIGRDWFRILFEGVVGAGTIHTTIDAIANDPEVGMCAASNLIVHDPPHKENLVIRKMKEYGIIVKKGYYFVAGTCFAVKPQCLQPLIDFQASLEDFVPVPPSRGLSLGHILERYMTICVTQAGYKLRGNKVMRAEHAVRAPLEHIFDGLSSEHLYDLPYIYDDEFFFWALDHFMVSYKTKKIRLRDIRYRMGKEGEIIPLSQCVPYRYLQGDTAAYEEYCRIHAETGRPLMSVERYDELISSMKKQGFDEEHIIMVDENNIVKDGQHRACWLAWKYGLDYEVEVLQVKVLAGLDLAGQMVLYPVKEAGTSLSRRLRHKNE